MSGLHPSPVDDRETLEAAYPRLRAFVDAIGRAASVQEIADLAVVELQTLTAFNRILLYSFDVEGEPNRVNPQIRSACDFVGQIASLQIGARERADRVSRRINLKRLEGELLAHLSGSDDFHAGVSAAHESWQRLFAADGVAVLSPEGVTALGLPPSTPELVALAQWRHGTMDSGLYCSDQLSLDWPQAAARRGAGRPQRKAATVEQRTRGLFLFGLARSARTLPAHRRLRRPAQIPRNLAGSKIPALPRLHHRLGGSGRQIGRRPAGILPDGARDAVGGTRRHAKTRGGGQAQSCARPGGPGHPPGSR